MALPVKLLLSAGLVSGMAQAGNITTGTDEQAQLPYWQYEDGGVSLRLVQRLPDQSRGFFMARGFSTEHAELIAQSCVFQTIFKNVSSDKTASPVSYDLNKWVITYNNTKRKMKTREDWAKQWEKLNTPQPARIAFEWALLPTIQTYQAGDYNWGMSIFNLKPGSQFDLNISWTQYGKQSTTLIRGIQCATDTRSQPKEKF
jgi:hypothetical protein